MSLYTAIFGDPNEKKIKKYKKEIEQIKCIEADFATKITTLDQVKAKTSEFQARFSGLDYRNESDMKRIREILEEIKLEALALHRTACRIINGKTFDISDLSNIHEYVESTQENTETSEEDANRNIHGHYTWKMVPFDVQLMG